MKKKHTHTHTKIQPKKEIDWPKIGVNQIQTAQYHQRNVTEKIKATQILKHNPRVRKSIDHKTKIQMTEI